MAQFRTSPPVWFRIVAIVLVLWGIMGIYACYQQFRFGAEAMGPATDYDRALYASLPGWYNAVYAVAVGSGFLGAVALLLRSAIARALFIVSLIAVVVMFGWFFATTDVIAVKGAATVLPFPIFIVAMAALGAWLGGYAGGRGWLK